MDFLFVRSLPRFIYRSLAPSFAASSLHPIPSRCRTTSVELIRYSRHIWTALTGINHECFWSARTGLFRLLVVSDAPWKQRMKSFTSVSAFMPNLLLFFSFFSVNFCLLLTFWHCPLCAFHPEPTQYVFKLMQPWNLPYVGTLRGKFGASPWSDCFALPHWLLYITYWLACRHDNNVSLWQQTSPEVDSRIFGHVMFLEDFPGPLAGRTTELN